jgi:hypothetical protein
MNNMNTLFAVRMEPGPFAPGDIFKYIAMEEGAGINNVVTSVVTTSLTERIKEAAGILAFVAFDVQEIVRGMEAEVR